MKNLNEIIAQKEAAVDSLMKMNGVNGVDVGYKYTNGKRTDEITIRVLVQKKKKNISDAEKIPEQIGGVNTDVIEMEVVPFTASKAMDEAILLADATKYSTVKGGISIGPERVINGSVYVGTLGAIVKDNVTNQPMLLSNFHVMCVDSGWHVGDQMDQPGRVDGGVPVTDRIGTLRRAVLSNHVDGAISSLSGRPYDCSVVGIGNVKGTASAVLNAPVRKRGRTTLLTSGFVDAINATVSINYGPSIGVKVLTNQIGIRPNTAVNPKFSDHGDSGSVVMDANNKVIGLLFAGNAAGYTYINPISFVLSELNVTLCKKLKAVLKEVKIEKIEIKEGKAEGKDKIEIKEGKGEGKDKLEKVEQKEFKEGKAEIKEFKEFVKEQIKDQIEKIPGEGKPIIDKLDKPVDGFDPGKINPGILIPKGGSVEERLASIEQAISGLTSFISSEMRPDLNSGALTNEDDIAEEQAKMEKDVADSMM
jgi:hypothetical protein